MVAKIGLEPISARCWIPEELGVAGFFSKLKFLDVNYVVLRWFETLPAIEKGEDIDLLVEDSDLEALLSLVERRTKTSIPIDVYSETGKIASDWRGIPYFPRKLSRAILDNSVELPSGIRVPDPKRYFLSLAYHVVYHKGLASGVRVRVGERPAKDNPDHDYSAILANLSKEVLHDSSPICLEHLEATLRSGGVTPGFHTEEFLARTNPFVADSVIKRMSNNSPEMEAISVFILRERAAGWAPDVRLFLSRQGFEVISEKSFEGQPAQHIAAFSRGGNWGQGPYHLSGGLPAVAFAVLDVDPISNPDLGSGDDKFSTNLRVQRVKKLLRVHLDRKQKAMFKFNPLHSTDNGLSAREFIEEAWGPDHYTTLLLDAEVAIGEWKASALDFPDRLGDHSRRSGKYLSRLEPKRVRKVFRRQSLDYLKSEIEMRGALADLPGVDIPLATGANFLEIPFITNARNVEVLTPLQILEVRDFLLHCARRGIQPIDFTPKNIALDSESSLRYLDFEYFQRDKPRKNLLKSAALFGLPNVSNFRRPSPYRKQTLHYTHHWLRHTLVPAWAMVLPCSLAFLGLLQRWGRVQVFFLDLAPVLSRAFHRVFDVRRILIRKASFLMWKVIRLRG
jgi:hypothetical protein